jgi:dipeptidase
MYFILFDPIFWINKTLATFDRMVARLQKYTEKVDAEIEATKGVQEAILNEVEDKTQKMADKANVKLQKIKKKSFSKTSKVLQKADGQVSAVRSRETALAEAKRRATNAARHINKLMED